MVVQYNVIPQPSDPGVGGYTVVPQNAADEGVPIGLLLSLTYSEGSNLEFRSLYVGTGGDVKIEGRNGDDVTFPSVPSGMILPIAGKKVYATGTTATNMVAIM